MMAQHIWIYCRTKIPIPAVSKLKMRMIERYAEKKELRCKGRIYEWKGTRKRGLRRLYEEAGLGKVRGVIIYSLKDIGDEAEQKQFIERMQERLIPVFCVKGQKNLTTKEEIK